MKIFATIFFLIFCSTAYANPWADSLKLEIEGKFEQAAQQIAPLRAAKPANQFALLRHGWLNYLAKNYNDSVKDYQQAIEQFPDSLDAKLGIMLPLLAQSRWNETELYAKKVLQVAPWQYYAHVRLMVCEEAQRQWSQLEAHAFDVSQRYPSDATILVYLGRAQTSQGKLKPALETFQRVLQIIPDHAESLRTVAMLENLAK